MIKEVKVSRVPRYDAALKVSGTAMYSSDHTFPDLAFAVPVCSKIGKGKIRDIDAREARKMEGVIEVFTHENIGKIYRPTPGSDIEYSCDETRPPFEDNIIRYYGQYIAVVVAESFEVASRAARSVKVSYSSEKPNLKEKYEQDDLKTTDHERGNAPKAFRDAEVKVDEIYVTPIEVHNVIELHATVAKWEDEERVTMYETSQAVNAQQLVMAEKLGLPRESVRVITKFLGSGFGGKLWSWPHSSLAAMTAKKLNRPVKFVIDRHMAFTNVGHRPRTQQKVQLASNKEGKFQALVHDYTTQAAMQDDYKENCGEASGYLYKIPDAKIVSGIARRNQSHPTAMRGPGAVPGLYALESAIDELAIKLKMDPVKLRILNDTDTDLKLNKKFSSRHLKECLELGAKKFGWEKRNPEIGSMKDGEEILGWGVACCSWAATKFDADATFKFKADGRVSLSCGTHDIGTGMYTVLAEIIKTETGLPYSEMEILLGDTNLPKGPIAGGSMATASVIPAVTQAIRTAITNLKKVAIANEKSDKKPENIKFEKGKVLGDDFKEIMKKANMATVEGRGSSKGNFSTADKEEYSTKSFGAQFVEIGWNPEIARLRVRRVVTVIDGGKIINFLPARNQVEGSVVMGVGMGMFEEALYDKRDGNVVNSNLADYIVASHADCPDIDVTFLDYPDKAVNEYGARGVGEIGLAGVAAAMTNAVYHATGIRVRELPITIEKLLKA